MGGLRSASARLQNKIGDMMPDLLLVFVGLLFVGLGVENWYDTRPIPNGVLTTGRIVEMKEVEDPDGGQPFRYPVVEYPGPLEGTRRFVVEFTGVGRVGETVPVRYDPDDPTRAQWADHPGRLLWLAFVGMGAVAWLLLFALWGRRWMRRRTG